MVFSGVRVTQSCFLSSVLYIIFSCLFVLFRLVIALFVLRFTASGYLSVIFKLVFFL